MKRDRIGINTGTIGKYVVNNLKDAFERTAKIGYSGVEIAADVSPLSVKEYKALLDSLNLKCVSLHLGLNDIANELQRYVDQALAMGCEYIVMAGLSEEQRGDLDAFRKIAETLGKASEIAADQGITVAYHNHHYEFVKFDGVSRYDILTDPAFSGTLSFELDVYWATKGGEDPLKLINKLQGRLPLLHMKDMEAGPVGDFAPVGEGIIDMPAIIAAGDKAGTDWFVVEQDVCKRDQMECAASSYNYLSELAVD